MRKKFRRFDIFPQFTFQEQKGRIKIPGEAAMTTHTADMHPHLSAPAPGGLPGEKPASHSSNNTAQKHYLPLPLQNGWRERDPTHCLLPCLTMTSSTDATSA